MDETKKALIEALETAARMIAEAGEVERNRGNTQSGLDLRNKALAFQEVVAKAKASR